MGKVIILRLLNSYFRHRWLYLAPIAVLTVVAVLSFFAGERLYISKSMVVIQTGSLLAKITALESGGFTWSTPAQDTADEISDLMKSDSFMLAVIDQTDLRETLGDPETDINGFLDEERERMWIVVSGPTQVEINTSDPDPEIAAQKAQAVVDKFLQWKINTSQLDSAAAVQFLQAKLEEKIAKHNEAQEALKQYIVEHPEPIRGTRTEIEQLEIDNLRSAVQFAGTQMSEAIKEEENAQIIYTQVEANVHQTYFLLDAPVVPKKPALARKQIAMDLAIYVVAGGILSVLLVIGDAVLSQALWFPMDIRNTLNLPMLAEVPDLRQPSNRLSGFFRKKEKKTAEPERIEDLHTTAPASMVEVEVEDVTSSGTSPMEEVADENDHTPGILENAVDAVSVEQEAR